MENSSNYNWTTEAKTALVLSFFKDNISIEELAQKHDLPQSLVKDWISRFIQSGKEGFNQR